MALVTVSSCVAAVESLGVDLVGGVSRRAVEQNLFIVVVLVLQLHLLLQELETLPQTGILDPMDLKHRQTSHLQEQMKQHQ